MVQLDESNIEIQVFSFFFLNILNGSGSIRQQIRSIFFQLSGPGSALSETSWILIREKDAGPGGKDCRKFGRIRIHNCTVVPNTEFESLRYSMIYNFL